MIRSTFLHFSGIGPVTEASLWRHGIRDWSELTAGRSIDRFSGMSREKLQREVASSEAALLERRSAHFAERLPPAEHWRLYSEFRKSTAFLDIETTGLSPYGGIVTVVTVHGGGATRSFVADDDLEELPAYLGRYQVLVTFNGRMFDVPFLEVRFPNLRVPAAHIDLRFLLHRLGYSGGLKRIEQVLGVGDRSGVEGIYGRDAVRLWEEFRRGQSASLERLIQYNRADTINLEPILDLAYDQIRSRLFGERAASSVG
ncbi:MAG: ribonuclease H-like domain-containing protein [Thermoplasmata archaeon]|nr:ribonuclease H-like domain-containing protein [Thermoplasmata archaeon]